ncbi:6,7-dimethyl-8-ribityllumazine synthase [Candidatus Peregrinibacteria bacterium]|nr:MAG: 6,7-dimethyl-8-ribityllumazine synthase [Candidatus Peregrinibacteria bacterium]
MSDWRASSETALRNYRVAIVSAEFNKEYSDVLLKNTLEGLLDNGITEDTISVVRVPGSFELPFSCARLLSDGKHDAIIALGILLRGETIHFDVVAREAACGIQQLNVLGKIPVVFGVLTCDTKEQIQNRLSLGSGFATTAIRMMNLMYQ